MIEPIITYLNALLTPLGFRTFPLTGLVERGDATFPAVYLRGGEYQAINAEVSTVYHRLLDGPNDTDDEDDESPVNNSIVTRTYSLRAVAIFPHDLYGDDDQYLEDKVIRNIAGQLKHRNIKTLKNTLELVEVSTIPGASARGREAWGEEFDGIEYVEKRRIVYVDYTLTLRGFSNCLDAVGCGDADIDVRQAIIDEYCTGACDPASITTNGDSPALEVASGASQDIAVHDSAGADVGTRSGATVTIADGTVTVNGAGSIAAVAEGTTNVNVENSAGTDVGSLAGSTVTVADADVNVNGSDYGSVVAEGAINVQVVDQSGVQVGSLNGAGEWEVNTAAGCPVGAKLTKTGQTTSYATGDDGDLQAGRDVDFYTLPSNNPFGNTNRFTDELGGSTYTNNIVIDWSTYDGFEVLGYYRVIAGNIDWATAISQAQALSVGGFSGWRNVNVTELVNVMNYAVSHTFNYPPFNATMTVVHSFWLSTTAPNSAASAMYAVTSSGLIGTLVKGATAAKFFAVRTFTVTGTTLT